MRPDQTDPMPKAAPAIPNPPGPATAGVEEGRACPAAARGAAAYPEASCPYDRDVPVPNRVPAPGQLPEAAD